MNISSGHGLDTIFRESCSSGVDLTKLVVSAEGIECDANGTGGAAKYKPRFLQSKKGRRVIATAKRVVVVVVWGARAKERKRERKRERERARESERERASAREMLPLILHLGRGWRSSSRPAHTCIALRADYRRCNAGDDDVING